MKTRLENVIEQVKAARAGANRPWIFTEDGKIADNIMCGEVLDVLEELKEHEISVSDEWIENFKNNPKVKGDNTYNYNANISNDLHMNYLENDDGEVIMLIMVHLYGDIRGGYSDYFVVMFDSMYEFFELESAIQVKDVNEHMVADLNIFSESYNVYDYEKQEDVGNFYEFELADLLEEIKNQGKD